MTTTEKYHFIGIGGIGMSGLAKILLSKNIQISGSDIAENYIIEGLRKAGADVKIGHCASVIKPHTTVVYSTDIREDNPEFKAAKELSCPLLHRSDVLMQLMQGYKTLAVAGMHGKTTTSSLLAAVLVEADWQPSYAIGGMVAQFNTNAAYGKGEYFVAEADESDGTFLKYLPYGAIVTNIDLEHLNYFGSEASIIKSFRTFFEKIDSPEHLFWCRDDDRLTAMNPLGYSYGFSSKADVKASKFQQKGWYSHFDIHFLGKQYRDVCVNLVGKHNALNALAVFGLCVSLGVPEEKIRKAFKEFQGVARRCQQKGDVQSVLFLDDYAHHPSEIRCTLEAIRGCIGSRRLIAVHQPHRYTRTKACLEMYQKVFEAADFVVVTDIFAASELPIPGMTSQTVTDAISSCNSVDVHLIPRNELKEKLLFMIRPHDVVVTLGAGDITKLGPELIASLEKLKIKKYKIGLLYGGDSIEHEITLLSAANIANGLNPNYYEIEYFGISQKGHWTIQKDISSIQEPNDVIMPTHVLEALQQCDVIFPVLHGRGEDGTVQGLLETLHLPYVGCDWRSSAIAMDKAMTKYLLCCHGLRVIPFISFSKGEWKEDQNQFLERIQQELTFPVFVKGVHLGSSLGVYKIEKPEDVSEAIEKAFTLDSVVLVENGISGRELEFSVLGNDREIIAFPPGEILTNGQVYDYESKYAAQGMPTTFRAEIPSEKVTEGISLVKKAYRAIGGSGMARIDTFLDKQGRYWINEINPIPGFTANSLYPQMCAAHGLSLPQLLDALIILGLERKKQW